MKLSYTIAAVLLLCGLFATDAEAGRRFRRHANGWYYRVDRYEDQWYGRDNYGQYYPVYANKYAGKAGLTKLGAELKDDLVWLQGFRETMSQLGPLGDALAQRGEQDVYGRYGRLAGPAALSGYSYRASSSYGYAAPQGVYAPQYVTAPATPDPLTTIKELTAYSARLAEQANSTGQHATERSQAMIDGTIQGLVNAERIRAAGDVAVATVQSVTAQEQNTEATYTYNSASTSEVRALPGEPAGGWREIVAARCVHCHSAAEIGGRGQEPLLDGELTPELKAKMLDAVLGGKMPADQDGKSGELDAEEFRTLVTGLKD